jgi:hypothetical protein
MALGKKTGGRVKGVPNEHQPVVTFLVKALSYEEPLAQTNHGGLQRTQSSAEVCDVCSPTLSNTSLASFALFIAGFGYVLMATRFAFGM